MSVTAILLAAGYATRLYPLTKDRPKALLPLGQGVILDEIVAALPDEVSTRILVTNHRFAGQFLEWQHRRGGTLRIIDDGTETPEARLGAVLDLELARVRGGATGDLLVLGTDNIFAWRLGDFVTRAQQRAPAASVALWEAPSSAAATQFGVVVRDATDRISRFVEKSPQPPSTAVALCVYYFPSPMVECIPRYLGTRPAADAPGHFIAWLAEQVPVYGLMMRGSWYDIGTLEAYQAAQHEWPATKPGG